MKVYIRLKSYFYSFGYLSYVLSKITEIWEDDEITTTRSGRASNEESPSGQAVNKLKLSTPQRNMSVIIFHGAELQFSKSSKLWWMFSADLLADNFVIHLCSLLQNTLAD